MENRFGFKDGLVLFLLVILLVSVWFAMKQFDRQWKQIQKLQDQVAQQDKSQARIENDLGQVLAKLQELEDRPVRVAAPPDGEAPSAEELAAQEARNAAAAAPDAFHRIRDAKELEGYAIGDWLLQSFGTSIEKITPVVSTDVYASLVQDHVLQSLAERDDDTLAWAPLVARDWSISEDGLVIRFNLRRGVRFSDGEPLTAEDVVYSYQLIMNPKIEAPRARAYYSKIEKVEAPSDYEVVFTFREPYFKSFELAAGLDILPKHFYSQYTPEEMNQEPGLLMGSGPYRMETPDGWAPGKPVALFRNERYWGVVPAFERLVYREINNPVAELTTFKNGELDVYSPRPEDDVKLKKDQDLLDANQRFEYERVTAGYGFIAWNQRRNGKPTAFADKRVRQAMTMLTDREFLCENLLEGYGYVVTGPYNRLGPQSDPSVEPWPYNVERANNLLAEVGYIDQDGDGVLETPDGEPFTIEITFPSTDGGGGFWDKAMLMLKDSYARAGVVIELNPLEWAVFSQRLRNREFQAICLGWSGGIESDPYQIFHSDQIADGGDNFVSYSNPELDKLIEQARSTIDEDIRMPLWQATHRILHEDQPYTFLYSRRSVVWVDDRIQNVERVTTGLNSRYEWFVPAPEQMYP